jgi:DNA-binding CsgD family transcriptional regulator
VLARIAAHMQSARLMRQARSALDAFGQATLAVRPRAAAACGRRRWPGSCWAILRHRRRQRPRPCAPGSPNPPRPAATGRLSAAHHQQRRGGWCSPSTSGPARTNGWCLREESDTAVIEALQAAFRLTTREAEVLYWVIKGKTSPDIGEILGSSPRTVNKHLEHVFAKLGVENRTAAASVAMARIRMGEG